MVIEICQTKKKFQSWKCNIGNGCNLILSLITIMILDFLLLYTRGTRLQEMNFPVKFHPSLRWCTFLSVTPPFVLYIWTDREVWGFWSAWKGFTLSCNRNEEWNTPNCNVFGLNHLCIFDIIISGHGYLYVYFHILAWTKRFFFFFFNSAAGNFEYQVLIIDMGILQCAQN